MTLVPVHECAQRVTASDNNYRKALDAFYGEADGKVLRLVSEQLERLDRITIDNEESKLIIRHK